MSEWLACLCEPGGANIIEGVGRATKMGMQKKTNECLHGTRFMSITGKKKTSHLSTLCESPPQPLILVMASTPALTYRYVFPSSLLSFLACVEVDGFEVRPASPLLEWGSKPRARCSLEATSFLGKFPGRKGQRVPPGNGFRCGCRSCATTAEHEQEPWRDGPTTAVVAKLCHHDYNSTGITASASQGTLLFCVHDPAWWWVKASNLGGLSGPVVRFNLAHVSDDESIQGK